MVCPLPDHVHFDEVAAVLAVKSRAIVTPLTSCVAHSAAELRARARLCADGRRACRILAIVMILDRASREEAARAGDMTRQTLRDGVHRYNEAGVDGLADQARSGRPARLSWVDLGHVASWIDSPVPISIGSGSSRSGNAGSIQYGNRQLWSMEDIVALIDAKAEA